MTRTIRAVYQGGVFRPSEPVAIEEGSQVELTVRAEGTAARLSRQPWNEFLAEIASLPAEGPDDGFSGADHDKILSGGTDAR